MRSETLRLLPYAGIPALVTALFLLQAGGPDPFLLLRKLILLVIGYVCAITDLKTKQIPNKLVLVIMASWILMITPELFLNTASAVLMLKDSAIGFATGGGLFLLVYLISRKGLGGGDVKFMAASGLYLGFGGVLPAMLYGSVLAALTALILIVVKKIGRKDTIPLVPFLYMGILITVFFQM